MLKEQLVYLLQKAGGVMWMMPGGELGVLGMAVGGFETANDPRLAYGYASASSVRLRPSAADISLMDEVSKWLSLIPDTMRPERYVVAHRMLWNVERNRAVWTYRRLSQKMHTSPRLVRFMEDRGVETIHRELSKTKSVSVKLGLYLRGWDGPSFSYAESAASVRH
jgi:hypothetical protein